MEILEFFFFFLIFCLHLADDRANVVDIVGKSYATESFDENEQKSLIVVGSAEITKAHGKHDISAPVITPNILV